MGDEFHRELPCELTDDEVADRAERMAQAVALSEERDAKRKEVAAAYKREVDALDAEVRLLGGIVRSRREVRDVLCVTRTRRDGSTIIVRTDTGAVVEVRNAMPGAQQPLWHDEHADADEPTEAEPPALEAHVEDAEYAEDEG